MTLVETTRSMLAGALEVYRDSPRATNWLRRHLSRFDEPLRLAVIGPAQSGKTTLRGVIAGTRSLRGLALNESPADSPDVADADAFLFLLRQPGDPDLRLLRAIQDHPIARAAPVNCVLVLSRADELGAGRVDALISARQIARRYRRGPEARELCQDVVAVAALVASAGRLLGEEDLAALSALAATQRAELDACLLSADRFVQLPAPVEPAVRQRLLAGFGLFGIRLATTLIRQGSATVPALSAELVQRSGLADLRDCIERYFTGREQVLKARAVLIALEIVLRMEPRPDAATLAAELDRVLAGAHEFRELRLIAALRTGRTVLPDDLSAEALRLIDGEDTEDPRDALRRWRDQLENPVFGAEERRAVAVVVRSLEGHSVQIHGQ